VEPFVITIKFIRTNIAKTMIPITKLPPTTKSPKLVMILLTASGPFCPLLKIILVVAIFSDSLKSVRMSIRVGKVVKSVGFGTYKDISKIKTAKAIETVSKTSSMLDGRGTMMMAKIAITNITTLKSLCPRRKFRLVPICCLIVSFFAKKIPMPTLLKYQPMLIRLKIYQFYIEVYLKMAIENIMMLYLMDKILPMVNSQRQQELFLQLMT